MNPYGIHGTTASVLETAANIGLILLLATVVASILALVLRFIRARGEERQQLKWIAYTAGVCVVSLLLGLTSGAAGWDPLAEGAWFVGEAALFSLPIAVGIAVLKYRLYDIDVIINRTLVYGALTALLALVYLGGVVGVGGLVRAMTRAGTKHSGGRRLHACGRRALSPRPNSHTSLHRPAFLSKQIRRAADDRPISLPRCENRLISTA